jgi:hypothetical protein
MRVEFIPTVCFGPASRGECFRTPALARCPAPCSLRLSATSQQYFSLTTNQPPATSQQYSSLRTNQHQPSATSQTNRLVCIRFSLSRGIVFYFFYIYDVMISQKNMSSQSFATLALYREMKWLAPPTVISYPIAILK